MLLVRVGAPRPDRGTTLVVGASEVFDAALDHGKVGWLPKNYENGVVTTESAQHFWPFLPVEGFGKGLRTSGKGSNNEEVTGSFCADKEGWQ